MSQPNELTIPASTPPTIHVSIRATVAQQELLAALDAGTKQLGELLEAVAQDAVQKAFFEYQAHRRAIAEQLT